MEVFLALEIIGLWFSMAFLTGLFAKVRRHRSGFGWFLLALLIGPLFALIVVAILKEKEQRHQIYLTQ